MKFEEVLIIIRKDGKKLEDFEHQVLSCGVWTQFSNETFTTWENLIKKEFRLKEEFTPIKKLRNFEFEAYLGEIPSEPPYIGPITGVDLISKIIGHHTSFLQMVPPSQSFPKSSKWKITMEEIIDE